MPTKYIVLLLFSILICCNVNGQSCYPNGISFSSQNEVDLFRTVNPGCTIIGGNLTLTSGNITNLDSLIGLEKIEGDFSVGTSNMSNFNGLNNLDSILGGINIYGTNMNNFVGLESLKQIGEDDMYSSAYSSITGDIQDFTGLDSLQAFYGDIGIDFCTFSDFQGLNMLKELGNININYCSSLVNFNGLDSLTNAGRIAISECDNFANTSGLNVIDSIAELEFSNLPALTSLEGLDNLKKINILDIHECNSLTNLNGLQSLQSINSLLFLRYNDLLASIDSLKYADMSGMSQLRIQHNSNLSECNIYGVCLYISEETGYTSIQSNAQGCNGATEISSSCCMSDPIFCPLSDTCYVTGVTFSSQNGIDLFRSANPGCKVIGGDLSLASGDITNLDSLIGLESILGDFSVGTSTMSNFNGLNNLDSILGGINIYGTNLNNFVGLESLKQIGEDDMYSSAYSSITGDIQDFTGLDSLQAFYGDIGFDFCTFSDFQGLNMLKELGNININYCSSLVNFDGLDSLTIAGRIAISECDNFANTSGLNVIDSIAELEFSNLPALTSLEGLDNLKKVKTLDIYECNLLTSLNGLQAIQSIENHLFLRYNDLLSSIDSLKYADMSEMSQLRIQHNSNLSECNIYGVCQYISEDTGYTSIQSNAQGCNGATEISSSCCMSDPIFCPLSDTCYVTGVTFSSQNGIDLFRSANPGCKVIGGNLSLASGDITNLDSLIGLESILGDFSVGTSTMSNFNGLNNLDSILGGINIYATNLNNFVGLESLKQIGEDDIYSSAYSSISGDIQDFTGLDSLQAFYGDIGLDFCTFSDFQGLNMLKELGNININYCTSLVNFDGLDSLTIAGRIAISECDNFANTSGLNAIDSIAELEFSNLLTLTSLEGLDNLKKVNSIDIYECNALANLNGLQSLQSINKHLFLRRNDQLSSIDSLKFTDMSGMSQLRIHNNPSLTVCSIYGICNYLSNDLGYFSIYSNGIGCNGTTEIEYDCIGQLFVFENNGSGFIANTSTSWHTASNWRNNQIPGPESWVIIPPNINCIIQSETAAECKILDLRENASITVKDGATLTVHDE